MTQIDLEASSRIVLDDGTILTRCDQCRQIYSERTPSGEPPCESCRIEMKAENEEAARIYQIVKGQVITRFNGESNVVVDLNHLSVWAAIDRYDVKNGLRCFELVMKTFYHFLNK